MATEAVVLQSKTNNSIVTDYQSVIQMDEPSSCRATVPVAVETSFQRQQGQLALQLEAGAAYPSKQ